MPKIDSHKLLRATDREAPVRSVTRSSRSLALLWQEQADRQRNDISFFRRSEAQTYVDATVGRRSSDKWTWNPELHAPDGDDPVAVRAYVQAVRGYAVALRTALFGVPRVHTDGGGDRSHGDGRRQGACALFRCSRHQHTYMCGGVNRHITSMLPPWSGACKCACVHPSLASRENPAERWQYRAATSLSAAEARAR